MRDAKAYFYETIADRYDAVQNPYDTSRRVEVVFDEMLGAMDLSDRTLLDIGSGVGYFSERASKRGARVTSLDIGQTLLAHTRRRSPSAPVAADACALPFVDGAFDVVISSECIEHTVDPARALREMGRVMRRGGTLVVTTPNRVWHFAVLLANALKLRPYEGYENWLGWGQITRALNESGLRIEQMRGFHLVPPVISPLNRMLRYIDAFGGRAIGPLMVNVAVRARK